MRLRAMRHWVAAAFVLKTLGLVLPVWAQTTGSQPAALPHSFLFDPLYRTLKGEPPPAPSAQGAPVPATPSAGLALPPPTITISPVTP